MTKKFDHVYDIETASDLRIAFDDALWDYVNKDEFRRMFYTFRTKLEFVKFLAKIVIDGNKLSSIDGFTPEHETMFDVLCPNENYIVSVNEMKNIRW